MFHWIVSVSIILSIFHVKIGAYNLNTKSPVVFSDPNAGHYRKGSYFGYGVALYTSTSDPLVLVGAPRANVSRLSEIKEPGAVYYCRLNGSCNEWPLDNSSNADLRGMQGIDQMIDESWIGATISVQNNPQPRVVVCAPRWTNIFKGRFGNEFSYKLNGICYYTIVRSSSAFEEPVQELITDLVDLSGQYRYIGDVGAMGFSLHEFSDEPIWNIMIGAPGCYGWSGTPLLISENESGKLSSLIPYQDSFWYTFRGYSVTSGFYFDDKRRWYVASAPRVDDINGKVEIFQYHGSSSLNNVKIVRGTQYGEYFGASVTSCDVDNDGRDELIVGAPLWSENGDEGRVYIISARKNSNGFDMTSINGKFKGARFGSSVIHLGDLDRDGYGDVAVGAPYEDKSGVVYIFNGGRYGLSEKPSQKIIGKDYGRLSGFGLTISEPRDIDGNGYPDVAIGAYRSGHAALFRAQPVVKVNISLNYVNSARLNSNTTKFSIRLCGYYDGHRVPETLRVKRIFKVDEAHHRARLDKQPSSNNGTYELEGTLYYRNNTCDDIPIDLKEGTKSINHPIIISSSLVLVDQEITINRGDSTLEHTLSLNFDLDCGRDDVCHSNLTSGISTSLGIGNKYIIGDGKAVNISIDIRNYGEPAYETQVHVHLPRFLSLASVLSNCYEHSSINGSVEVICDIGNPLLQHPSTTTIELSMRQVMIESEFYSDSIKVPITLTTQSQNINDKKGIDNVMIYLAIDADINITGQTKDNSYSYLSSSDENKLEIIQFQHIYGVQKLGITPIQQASLIVLVPTHLRKSTNEIIEIARINATTLKFFDTTNANDNDYVCKTERIGENEKKIIERESNNFTHSVDVSLRNRALFMNCENVAINVCVNVTCLLDVPKTSVNPSVIAELKLTIDLLLKNITDDFMTLKDIIYFVSNGSVMITHPSRATQTPEMRRSSTLVSTQFLGTPVAAIVASWVIAVSILVGILLLVLLIFAFIKLGFFKRKQKEALAALMTESEKKQGLVIETSSSREGLDQD